MGGLGSGEGSVEGDRVVVFLVLQHEEVQIFNLTYRSK